MKLSKYFTLEELTFSQTAARRSLDNSPTPEQVVRLRSLCQFALDPIVDVLGPVAIVSGFRAQLVNQAIGGGRGSSHLDGEAADFRVVGRPAADVFQAIRDIPDLPFDQLALEFGRWIHISYHARANRGEILVYETSVNGPTVRLVERRGMPNGKAAGLWTE